MVKTVGPTAILLRHKSAWHCGAAVLELDLPAGIGLRFDDALARSVLLGEGERSLAVYSDLLTTKEWASRPKDIVDGAYLRALLKAGHPMSEHPKAPPSFADEFYVCAMPLTSSPLHSVHHNGMGQ